MREPFHLRAPLPPNDEDRKLIELQRQRCLPAQVIKQIEHFLSENGAAEHRIVWAGKTDPRNFHDLLRERTLVLVERIHRQLGKARRFAHDRVQFVWGDSMPFKICVQAAMLRPGSRLVSEHWVQFCWLAPKAGVASNATAIETTNTISMG